MIVGTRIRGQDSESDYHTRTAEIGSRLNRTVAIFDQVLVDLNEIEFRLDQTTDIDSDEFKVVRGVIRHGLVTIQLCRRWVDKEIQSRGLKNDTTSKSRIEDSRVKETTHG